MLNPNFAADHQCLAVDLDGVAGDEVIIGGRETGGLGRGPAYQVWDKDGNFVLGRFVLNPNFTEVKITVADVTSNGVIASGRETGGLGRGPTYQVWDKDGNFVVGRFVLNPDFTDVQVFGANTTNGVAGDEVVVGGTETGGLARGPAFQVRDMNGNFLLGKFVLTRDSSGQVDGFRMSSGRVWGVRFGLSGR